MLNRLPLILLALFLCSTVVDAQDKAFEKRQQTWLGYFNQTRLTNKSGIWLDLHVRRTDDFMKAASLSMARAGYIYYITDNTRLTIGHSYIHQYSANGPDIPEHRPWQQIQWLEKKSFFSMMQYFRLEERFRRKVTEGKLIDDYAFNYRFRYNISLTFPLTQKTVAAGTPFIFASNEVFINAGKEIVNNYFDQNRFFVGIGYQFTSHLNAHIGYLNVFQQLPGGNSYVKTDAIRLFVFHNLDLRKADAEKN